MTLVKAKLSAVADLAQVRGRGPASASCSWAQVQDSLNEIAQQRAECRINAPSSIQPDSMVVYFKNESNRFGQSNQAMIEQGAQVKEGQKMLRIPNLRRMQVNTKVHEAMVARIRADVRVPTHMVDTVQNVTMLTTRPVLAAVGASGRRATTMARREVPQPRVQDHVRGQKASVRVDAACPTACSMPTSRTVAAAVASQARTRLPPTSNCTRRSC